MKLLIDMASLLNVRLMQRDGSPFYKILNSLLNAREIGRKNVLDLLEMKLLDGTEANVVRAEAAKRIRDILKETDELEEKYGSQIKS